MIVQQHSNFVTLAKRCCGVGQCMWVSVKWTRQISAKSFFMSPITGIDSNIHNMMFLLLCMTLKGACKLQCSDGM